MNKAVELFDMGLSIAQIARNLSLSERQVGRRIGAHPRREAKREEWSEEHKATAIRMFRAGFSNPEIAEAVGRTRNTVASWLHNHGLKRETPKPAVKMEKAPPPPWQPRPVNVFSPSPKTLLDRQSGQCCYPVSGEGADTLFCANPTCGTYCTGHRKVMTAAPTEADRKLLKRLRRMVG